jgi:hypothetical protein
MDKLTIVFWLFGTITMNMFGLWRSDSMFGDSFPVQKGNVLASAGQEFACLHDQAEPDFHDGSE